MTKRTVLTMPAALALLFALTGCGSSDPETTSTDNSPSASASAPEESEPEAEESQEPEKSDKPESEPADQKPAVITISDFAFESPDSVSPGQTIKVTNEDDVLHTVTADDGSFDVPVDGGATVTFKAPTEAGKFPFICTPHPTMTSTLVVG